MQRQLLKPVDGLILVFIVFWTHISIFTWFVRNDSLISLHILQLQILFVIVMLVIWRIRFSDSTRLFFKLWKQNWIIAVFVVLAISSLFWTVSLPATFHQVFLLCLVTIIASYMGLLFSARDLVNFIAITIGVFAIASLFLIIAFPGYGIHSEYPYAGLWHGIFWNKIYLGATMALGYIVYLVILFSPGLQFSRNKKLLAGVMLIICLVLAIKSDSASGLIVFAIQTVLFVVVLTWLKIRHTIPRWAYWVVGSVLVLAAILVISNLDFVFGLFNRSANMTGRIPMWAHLFDEYILDHPFFGYGFGAFWKQPGITQTIQSVVDWYYPVLVSDNGYMDILLGLGITGLLSLILIIGIGIWRTFRNAIRAHDLISFFPLFVLVHIIFINISLSYFFENEIFIWFLLVLVLFMQIQGNDSRLHVAEELEQTEE